MTPSWTRKNSRSTSKSRIRIIRRGNLTISNHNLLRNLKSGIWQIKFSKLKFCEQENLFSSNKAYFGECLPIVIMNLSRSIFAVKSSISFHESKSSSENFVIFIALRRFSSTDFLSTRKKAFSFFLLVISQIKGFSFSFQQIKKALLTVPAEEKAKQAKSAEEEEETERKLINFRLICRARVD